MRSEALFEWLKSSITNISTSYALKGLTCLLTEKTCISI